MDYTQERRVAVEAVLKASLLCREVQSGVAAETTITKEDRSPVTVADFGSQAVVSLEIGRAFAHDPIMGEETADSLRGVESAEIRRRIVELVERQVAGQNEEQVLAAIDRCHDEGGPRGRHWVLDPLDGTKGFLRGDHYAIALALVDEGEVVVGALGCPNLLVGESSGSRARGCLFVAVRGGGAFARPLEGETEERIRVSEVADAQRAALCESVEAAHSSHAAHARIADLLGITESPVRMDSQCKYAVVARGQASIYLRLPKSSSYKEKVWDHAAGWIVVEEAGGRVSDAAGQPLDFSGRTLKGNRGIVATNRKIHTQVLDAVRQVMDRL